MLKGRVRSPTPWRVPPNPQASVSLSVKWGITPTLLGDHTDVLQ